MRIQIPLFIIMLTSAAVFGLFMSTVSYANQFVSSPSVLLAASSAPTVMPVVRGHGGGGGHHGGNAWHGGSGWHGGHGWRHGGSGFYGYTSPYTYGGSYYTSSDQTCVWDGYQYTCYNWSY